MTESSDASFKKSLYVKMLPTKIWVILYSFTKRNIEYIYNSIQRDRDISMKKILVIGYV